MRIVDDETICVPYRQNCIRAINHQIYETVGGYKTLFKLKLHPKYFLVRTWLGLGDVLYQRPFIKELHKKYQDDLVLKTPWAELFPNIKLMNRPSYLQAQTENIQKNIQRYLVLHNRVNLKLGYSTENFKKMSMIAAIEANTFKLQHFDMDLKIEEEWMQKARELCLPANTVLLYWPTLRYEWFCPERNPDPKYFQYIVDNYKDFYFIVLSYLRPNLEAYEIEPQNVQRRYEHGELHYTTIFALMKLFPSIIRPSFTLPAAISIGGRSLCLYGGHLPPRVLTDPRMNLDNYRYVAPQPFTDWTQTRVNKVLDIDQIREQMKWLISGGM